MQRVIFCLVSPLQHDFFFLRCIHFTVCMNSSFLFYYYLLLFITLYTVYYSVLLFVTIYCY